jgi:ATP-dependent Clp protease protease subunit
MAGGYSMKARGAEAEVYIYEDVGSGWFGGVSAKQFAEDLKALGDVSVINVHINSYGGEVFDGVAIYTQLKNHPAKVISHIDGVAASIASVIAMAGDSVTMGRGTRMMIHNPSAGVIGQATDLREIANLLDEIGKDIAGFYAARGGKDVAHWLALMEAETWYSAQEAVDAGLADAVLGAAGKDDDDDDEAKNVAEIPDLRAYGFRYADRSEAPDPGAVTRTTKSDAAKARVHNALKGVTP